jgi:hypothetical protein
MTRDLPETIKLHQSILNPLGSGAAIGGDSYTGDQGRWTVCLAIKNDTRERDFHGREGDTFEFPGVTWRATNHFEVYLWGRPRVATLTRVK